MGYIITCLRTMLIYWILSFAPALCCDVLYYLLDEFEPIPEFLRPHQMRDLHFGYAHMDQSRHKDLKYDDDFLTDLRELCVKNPWVQTISLRRRDRMSAINDTNIGYICDIIQYTPYLQWINLQGHDITDRGFKKILKTTKKTHYLRKIYLNGNKIKNKDQASRFGLEHKISFLP